MTRHGLLYSPPRDRHACVPGASVTNGGPLRLKANSPGKNAFFTLSSQLLLGQHKAKLVKRIQANGNPRNNTYLSHSAKDFSIGPEVLKPPSPRRKYSRHRRPSRTYRRPRSSRLQ